jgi:hypothetical protein
MQQMAARAREYGMALAVVGDAPVNDLERRRVRSLLKEIREMIGPLTLAEKLKQAAAHVLAAAWRVRLRLRGDEIQPKTIVTHYPAESWTEIKERGLEKLREIEEAAAESLDVDLPKAAIIRHRP